MRFFVRSFPWRRVLLALIVVGATAGAHAQVCQAELASAFAAEALSSAPTGIDAATVLRRAVELVEPALPPLQYDKPVPLDTNDPNFQTVKYLVERKLLPASWTAGELNSKTWASMLDTFLTWYRLPASGVDAPGDVAALVDDMSRVLGSVSHAIRPAALLATDPKDSGRTSFWAIIWNWTVYPRLLVVRPDPDAGTRPADALAALSNCAVHITAYISAPEDSAKSLFLSHNDSRMYVVSSVPSKNGFWPYEVAAGEELSAFAFDLPDLSGVRLYAAVFDGPSAGFVTLLGLFWNVRTNLAPTTFMSYLSTP